MRAEIDGWAGRVKLLQTLLAKSVCATGCRCAFAGSPDCTKSAAKDAMFMTRADACETPRAKAIDAWGAARPGH